MSTEPRGKSRRLPGGPHPTAKELMRFVEGTSSKSRAASIERHVGACRQCKKLVADLATLVREAAEVDMHARIGEVIESFDEVFDRVRRVRRLAAAGQKRARTR